MVGRVGIMSRVTKTASPNFGRLGVFLIEKNGASDINDAIRANIRKPHGKLSHPGTLIPP
jgi:hypothetical protein